MRWPVITSRSDSDWGSGCAIFLFGGLRVKGVSFNPRWFIRQIIRSTGFAPPAFGARTWDRVRHLCMRVSRADADSMRFDKEKPMLIVGGIGMGRQVRRKPV